MHHLEIPGLLHQRHGQMRKAAIADRPISQRIGLFPGRRDHFPQILPGAGVMRGDDHGRGANQHDRREIPFRIKAQIWDQKRVHRMGIEYHDPAIAIGCRARRRLGAERP